MCDKQYYWCKGCGNVVYRLIGHTHGDGQADSDETPVYLLGSMDDVDDASKLPEVYCGCNE